MKELNTLVTVPKPAPRPVRWDQGIVARYIYELVRGLA
jgi:hypothetical protein